jgi:hypothetical protein
MKAQILIILLISLTLLLGCTQEEIKIDTNSQTLSDTNINSETQIIEQQINQDWINENEVLDIGSVI